MANAPFRIRGGALVEGQMMVSAPPTETSHVVTLGYLDSVLPEEVDTDTPKKYAASGQVLMGNGLGEPEFDYTVQEMNIVETKDERIKFSSQTHLESLAIAMKRWYGFGYNTVGDKVPNNEFAPTIINQSNNENRRVTINLSATPQQYNFYMLDDYAHNTHLTVSISGVNASAKRPAGIVIAYVEISDIEISTLSIVRGFEGQHKWALVYNYGQSDERILAEKNTAIFSDPSTMNWSNSTAIVNMSRTDSIISCSTSQFNNPLMDPTSTIVLDLADDPLTRRFMRSSDYGLVSSLNQGLVIALESTRFEYDYFVDISQNKVYRRGIDQDSFYDTELSAQGYMYPRTLYRSLVNGLYYFIREHGTYERISRRHDGEKVEDDLAAGDSIVLTPSSRDYSSMLDFNPNPFVVESDTSYVRSSDIEVKYNPQAGTVTLTNNSSTTKKVSYTRPAEYGV